MATITPSNATPVHGNPINFTVAAAPNNTATGYNTANYPASPQVTYLIRGRATGHDDLFSEVFSTNPDGSHVWPSVVIPAAATWTCTLRNAVTDTQIATTTVTAS